MASGGDAPMDIDDPAEEGNVAHQQQQPQQAAEPLPRHPGAPRPGNAMPLAQAPPRRVIELDPQMSHHRMVGLHEWMVGGFVFVLPRYYEIIKPIGTGAYGVVCSAKNLMTGERVAIKKITRVFENPIETKRTIREVRLLRHFQHENVVQLRDVIRNGEEVDFTDVYVVTELMDTDLHQVIVSPQRLSEDHIQYFVYQILRGLVYIHSAGVLHRDLKPSNILLNGNCDLKICDFGLARIAFPFSNKPGFMTEYVATRWYRAPEIMLSWKEYTKAVDVWSVGCIFAELLARKPLFPGKDYLNQLECIFDVLGTPSPEDSEYIASTKARRYVRNLPQKPPIPWRQKFPRASPEAIDLLDKMLQFNPDKRITVDQALRHPYLKVLHDPTDEPQCRRIFDFSFEADFEDRAAMRRMLYRESTAYEKVITQVIQKSIWRLGEGPLFRWPHDPEPETAPSDDLRAKQEEARRIQATVVFDERTRNEMERDNVRRHDNLMRLISRIKKESERYHQRQKDLERQFAEDDHRREQERIASQVAAVAGPPGSSERVLEQSISHMPVATFPGQLVPVAPAGGPGADPAAAHQQQQGAALYPLPVPPRTDPLAGGNHQQQQQQQQPHPGQY